MDKYWAPLCGLVILVLVNWAIYDKEQHLAEGRVVYLELAPVDPRSLMQGDYMALRFAMGNDIRQALRPEGEREGLRLQASGGYAVAQLDQNHVARFLRLDNADVPTAENELLLRYRVRDGRVKFATNAFFFQEGHAERYQAARYGQFRVNEKGEPLLVSMHDEHLVDLGEH